MLLDNLRGLTEGSNTAILEKLIKRAMNELKGVVPELRYHRFDNYDYDHVKSKVTFAILEGAYTGTT